MDTELRTKLLKAQSEEELALLLKEEGWDEKKIERAWDEISRHREQFGKELSLEEMENIAGGISIIFRDYYKEGCAATVEMEGLHWCGSNDSCAFFEVSYYNYD